MKGLTLLINKCFEFSPTNVAPTVCCTMLNVEVGHSMNVNVIEQYFFLVIAQLVAGKKKTLRSLFVMVPKTKC